MKKCKLLIMLFLALFVVAFTACEDHEHEYTKWTVEVEPTETTAGKVKGECDCEEKATEEFDVPAFSDTSFWTLEEVQATCKVEGEKKYTCQYCTITVKTDKLAHTYGEWTITTSPSADAAGKAERVCSVCSEKEEVTVGKLTDTSVWTLTETAATCKEEGNQKYTSVYGEVNVKVEKGAHTYGAWTITTDPTADADGKAERVCSVCGEKEEVTVPKLTEEGFWEVSTTDATCETEGTVTYTCEYGVVTLTNAKLDHTGTWTITTTPTESEDGKAEKVCSVCGEKEEVTVPKLTDSVWTFTETAATCENAGNKKYTSVYGEVNVAIEKLAHSFGAWTMTTIPTETAEGKAERVCATGGEKEEVTVPKLTDSVWTLTETAATCGAAGNKKYTSVYGEVNVVIEKLAHSFGAWTMTTTPTESAEGKAERVCSVCSEKEEVTVPKLTDSVWTLTETAATCENAGNKKYTSVYGEVNVVIEKLAHNNGAWTMTTIPTETAEGKAEKVCSVCSEKEEVTVPKLTDSVWTLTETAATCETAGNKKYTSVYGEVNVAIEKLAHTGTWTMTTIPTENTEGSATIECSVCGNSETVTVPVLTDTTVWTVNTTTATCIVAGKAVYTSIYGVVELEGVTVAHTYGAWTITTTPTETAEGAAERVCSVCSDKEEATVPALTDEVWTLVVVPATCEKEGSETYTSIYGEITKVLEKVEHNFGEWIITTEPTLESVGSAKKVCAAGLEETVAEVPVLTDEVWTLVVTEPTCSVVGTNTYTSIYGEVVVEIPVVDHNSSEWIITVDPTESKAGTVVKKCTVGGEVLETKQIPYLLSAIWTLTEETDSTCDIAGYKKYISMYGEVIVTKERPTHTLGDWTIDSLPTVTEKGEKHATCSVCSNIVTEEIAELSDTTVWTMTVITESTYNSEGEVSYTADDYDEILVATAKLEAPYDNKTYSVFGLEAGEDTDYESKKLSVETAWSNSFVEIGPDSKGDAQAFPFRGQTAITMVDPLTGEILIVNTQYNTDDPENPVLIPSSATPYPGYVDFNTGIIVRVRREAFNDILVLTPFEINPTSSCASASSWDNAIAIEYTFDNTTYRMFVYNNVVYFGVTFTNELGEAVLGEECFEEDYLYVKDSNGNLIASFGHDGTELVPLDGYEGTYTNGITDLFVSGFGTMSYLGQEGTYTLSTGATYTADVYSDGKYYELTLNNKDMTYRINFPTVRITFDAKGLAYPEPINTNKNIEITLPVPINETKVFRGWFEDPECTIPVGETIVPTANITLYALWKDNVVINLVGVIGDDPSQIVLGADDIIGEMLPNYVIDEETNSIFKGWYLEEDFITALPLEYELTADNTGLTIYAKWFELPVYYGEYYGMEVWSSSSASSTKVTLTIDENGKITSSSTKLNGQVSSYDPETQMITWINSSSEVKYSWYDETTGILLTDFYLRNTDGIGYDTYVFSKYNTNENYKVKEYYGVKVVKSPGSTQSNFYAKFINIMGPEGNINVFFYTDVIYSNITIENAFGKELDISDISNSKSVVVRNKETKEVIFAVASTGVSFDKQNTTVGLDDYFGVYTRGTDSITLDGTGVITFGDKTGTYTKADETATYDFDVYFVNEEGKNIEYRRLTLDGTTYSMTIPTIQITYVTGDGHVIVPTVNVNANVQLVLADGSDDGFVFNGWFFDQEFTQKVPDEFIPTRSQTLYAKYSDPAVLSINYNSTQENESIIYSVGDITVLEDPTYKKHIFEGWFTTPTFDDGTKWTAGSAINEDVAIYAKWSDAPKYTNLYYATEIEGKNANGNSSSLYTRTSAPADIDPYGKGTGKGYPFNGALEITDYNEETGYLRFHAGTTIYEGFLDKESEIIILNRQSGIGEDFQEVLFMNPYETTSITSKILSSYWNSGKTRVIQYTFEGNTYSVFIQDNNVYFGATFKDANGNDIAGNVCYKATVLYVYANDNSLIAKFGFDGTTMRVLDGYEGDYTFGDSKLNLDGVENITIDNVTGKYYLAEEGSLYTIDAYINNEFFEITVDKENMTFVSLRPTVIITFETYGKAVVETVETNKNINITLEQPTNDGFIFRNWYLDSEFTTEVSLDYKPTENVTLYAKWAEKVTLTIVYGNDLENLVQNYAVGDITSPKEPLPTGGKVFDGWFTDPTFQNQYTPGEITESTIIYCNWKEAIALYGTYIGANVFGTGSDGKTNGGSASYTLTIDDSGNVSGRKNGEITDYNPETGTFTLNKGYGYYDAESGILICNYYDSSSSTEIVADMYIFFKDKTYADCTGAGSKLLGGKVKILDFKFDAKSEKTVTVLIYDSKVYYNVKVTSNGEVVSAVSAYEQTSLVVTDSKGKVIVNFAKSGSNHVVVTTQTN